MNKKSDRRDELLKMAAQVFYEKGFAQTTLQDIADRMNFTKPFERLIAAHMRIFIENVQANSILEVARGVLTAETQSRMKFLEREYSSILRAVYSEGVADGTLADVDSGLVVNTVLGACNMLHRWYDPSGAASPDKFVESILQLLGSGFNNRQN